MEIVHFFSQDFRGGINILAMYMRAWMTAFWLKFDG